MKKIISLFICTLLIATTVSAVDSFNNSIIRVNDAKFSLKYIAEDWTETQKLFALDGEVEDWFGCSVSIDDDTAIIGASGDEDDTGAAYIFKWNGNNWIQQQKLTSSKNDMGDVFGHRVTLDGNTAFISAYGNESVYVFKYNGASWIQHQKLVASDGEIGDRFGISVSFSGIYALIGSQTDDDGRGSVYVFK